MGMLCNAVVFLFFKKYNIVTDNVLFMFIVRRRFPTIYLFRVQYYEGKKTNKHIENNTFERILSFIS